MISDADIEQAARELTSRHGGYAVAAAQERVDELMRLNDHPAAAVALRVLSACERLAKESAAAK